MQSEDIVALGVLVGIPLASAIIAGAAAFYLYFGLIFALPAFFFAYFSDPLFAGALSQAITDTTNDLIREKWGELIGDPLDPSPLASHEPSHPASRSFFGYLKANFALPRAYARLQLADNLDMRVILQTLGDALRASVDLTCLGAIYCWLFWSEGIFWFWTPTQDLYEQDRRNRRILAKLNDTLVGFAQQILRDRYRSLDRPPAATPVPGSPGMAQERSRPTRVFPARYRSISDDSSRAVVGSDIDMYDPFFSDSSEVDDTPRSAGQSSADQSSGPEQSSRPASPRFAGWIHIEFGPVDENDIDQSPHESSSEEPPSYSISPSITMSTLPSTNIATPPDDLGGDTSPRPAGGLQTAVISTDLDALLRALPTNILRSVQEEELPLAAGPVEPDASHVTAKVHPPRQASGTLTASPNVSKSGGVPRSSPLTGNTAQRGSTSQNSADDGARSDVQSGTASSSHRRNEALSHIPDISPSVHSEAQRGRIKRIKVGPKGRLVDEQAALKKYFNLQEPPQPWVNEDADHLRLWSEFEASIRPLMPTKLLLPDGGRGAGDTILFRCSFAPKSALGSMYFYARRKQQLGSSFKMLRSLLTSTIDKLTLDGPSATPPSHHFTFYGTRLADNLCPNDMFSFGRNTPVKMLQIYVFGEGMEPALPSNLDTQVHTAGEPWNLEMLCWAKKHMRSRYESDPAVWENPHCFLLQHRLSFYANSDPEDDYDVTSPGGVTISPVVSVEAMRWFETSIDHSPADLDEAARWANSHGAIPPAM